MKVSCSNSVLFCSTESIEDVEFKKLATVNQDLYKMWQVNQTENAKLKVTLHDLKRELNSAKEKLDKFTEKLSESTVDCDQKKQEKDDVVQRMTKMESNLKMLVVSETITDQTMQQMKLDNTRLRSENRNLAGVVSNLAK